MGTGARRRQPMRLRPEVRLLNFLPASRRPPPGPSIGPCACGASKCLSGEGRSIDGYFTYDLGNVSTKIFAAYETSGSCARLTKNAPLCDTYHGTGAGGNWLLFCSFRRAGPTRWDGVPDLRNLALSVVFFSSSVAPGFRSDSLEGRCRCRPRATIRARSCALGRVAGGPSRLVPHAKLFRVRNC